ncbi:MAG: hypothetical protein ACI4MJ_02125 [Aristaeellaceae bacterium]
MKVRESIVPGWREGPEGWVYPPALGQAEFVPWGFDTRCLNALDMLDWAGFDCLLDMAQDGEVAFCVSFASKGHNHASHVSDQPLTARCQLTAGRHRLFLPLSAFEQPECRQNVWRFVRGVAVRGAQVVAMTALKARALAVDCPVRGRSAAPGETVCYQARVTNTQAHAVMVAVRQRCEGWECMLAQVTPAVFRLDAGESRDVTIEVRIPAGLPAGSHEQTTLVLTADGDGAAQTELSLVTMSALAHPFLYHDRAGWADAGRRGRELPQFRESYDTYLRDADAYEVRPPEQDKPYCYPTQVEHDLMSCAYAYGMTQDITYARKIAAFFRHFIAVYPKRQRGCSQSYVQEGHFFQHLAICYDMIHDAGVLSPREHAGVEACFRFYMEVLDQHLRCGHISNWLLSEITGAVYCALALQDAERTLRFTMGPGGTRQQLVRGAFNDGWWFECSVSYNTWVSSMLLHTARVLGLLGIDWIHTAFPVSLSPFTDAVWMGQKEPPNFDMDRERRGGISRMGISIKDILDAPLPYLDSRGVIFGICDSYERMLEGVHFGSTYELAYHYYHDARYIPVIRQMTMQDCVFGVENLPEEAVPVLPRAACSDNIGIAMLRSAAPGRKDTEQLQAVLRYGSHGGAHGHFDRASLLSVMRYGRSFFNPECVWWGYPHFMYKFYVQNSMTKNMVAVDEKHQNVADSRLTLFAQGRHVQAACVETEVTWSYPPYGGMVYDVHESLEERCRFNGCTLRSPDNAPAFGQVTGYTEPIATRRLMAVTEDYIVLFDALGGSEEHRFSNLFQIKGFRGLTGPVQAAGHTRRFSDDPLGDAQFITDCQHFDAAGTTCAHFCTVFGPGEDLRGTRSERNEPGLLCMDVHAAWPRENHQVLGLVAEDHHMYIPVRYAVETDGQCVAQGDFGAWLGCTEVIDCDVTGASALTLRLTCPPLLTEQLDPFDSKQGLFLGDAVLTLADGSALRLSQLPMARANVDEGHGLGRDYEGGRVLLCGQEMPDAIPVSPMDHHQEAVLTIDLRGLQAVRLHAELGADAFPGDEEQRRRTYAIQTRGRTARFITVVEPYEAEAMVAAVEAPDADTVRVTLRDGRIQTLRVEGLTSSAPVLHYSHGDAAETLSSRSN